MRLRTTLFGLLVVIAIVLAGIVYAGFALHTQDIADQERRTLNVTAENVALELDTRLEEKQQTVALWGTRADVASHGSVAQQTSIESFVGRSAFDGASVVATNGTIVSLSSARLEDEASRDLVGTNLSDRRYVRAALNGTTFVSDPIDASSENRIVVVSAPVRAHNRVVGALNAAIYVEGTTLFTLSADRVGEGSSIAVTNGSVPIVASADPPTDRIVANATVDETGWTVTVGESRATITDPVRRATLVQLGAVLLAVLSVALVGVWVSRTTVTNLEHLIDGLEALEGGNYGAELDVGVTDEWERISGQFNALSTELRQRESQLLVLNRVLRHNLRNDMSVVIASAETVIHDDDVDESTRERVSAIHRTATNLMETSEHARTLYEELISATDPDREPVDAAAVVERTVAHLREAHPESTIETRTPDAAWVTGLEATEIVLDELCRNALLHNERDPADREVTVRVEPDAEGRAVRLVVSDNGPGLPDVEREMLTGQREETPVEHGSGLGLWLVNWLVDALDGHISGTVDADRGTTITVTLPAAEAPDDGG